MRYRAFVLAGLLVAVLLGGVVSYWASSSPDGLNRVAADHGFDTGQTRHGTSDSPLAGYGIRGVGDTWLSGAVAGVAGVGVCFAVAGGVGLAVRRRRNSPADAVHTPAAPDDAGHAHHDAGGEQRDGRP